MARVSTYLNFDRQTEAAFEFYRTVFGTDYSSEINRMGAVPPVPGQPELSDEDKQLVMNVQLPILGGHVLMGTDVIKSMGHSLVMGDNIHIMLEPDSRAEADELHKKLSDGGKDDMPMQDMFWGDYYGQCTDKFGVHWMFNTSSKE